MKTTSHLATTLFQLGEMTESCEFRKHISDVRNRTLGPDDPTTLRSLENVANALQWIDEVDEAKLIYENVLAKRVRLFGMDHPDTQRTSERLSAIDQHLETDT